MVTVLLPKGKFPWLAKSQVPGKETLGRERLTVVLRVVAFAAYVQEEIFGDASHFTIATGCTPRPGTSGRTGLRGQPNRCTLGDFCEHVWKKTTDTETKPTGVDWGKNDGDINDKKMTPEDLLRKIDSQLKMTDASGKKVKMKKPGFTGKADGALIHPGLTPSGDGLKDYFNALEHCGNRYEALGSLLCSCSPPPRINPLYLQVSMAPLLVLTYTGTLHRMVEAKTESDKISDSLDDDTKKLFGKWASNGRDGAELLYDLRKQDKWHAMYGDKGKLDDKMGVDTAKKPGTSKFKYVNAKGPWNAMDVAGTIDKYTGANFAEKADRFFEKWGPIQKSDVFKNHQTALLSVEKIKIQTAGCM